MPPTRFLKDFPSSTPFLRTVQESLESYLAQMAARTNSTNF